MNDDQQLVAELVKHLRAVIQNHCPNEKLFCSTCGPARALLERLEAKNEQMD